MEWRKAMSNQKYKLIALFGESGSGKDFTLRELLQTNFGQENLFRVVYGSAIDNLSKDKINIGIYDIRRIQQIIKNENIECYPIYIKSSDKTRLLRQLQREESPDCDEIIRRFIADKKDFIPVVYNTTGFDFTTIENKICNFGIRCSYQHKIK